MYPHAAALHHLQELAAQLDPFEALLETRREPGEARTTYDRLLRRAVFAGRQPAAEQND